MGLLQSVRFLGMRTLSPVTVGENHMDPADKHTSPLNYTGSPLFTDLNTNCSSVLGPYVPTETGLIKDRWVPKSETCKCFSNQVKCRQKCYLFVAKINGRQFLQH